MMIERRHINNLDYGLRSWLVTFTVLYNEMKVNNP